MPKKRTSRLYLRSGGWYADLRDLTTEKPRRAMIPDGATRATTDLDEATMICTKLVAQLEAERRGIAIVGRGALTKLGQYAEYHLKQKKEQKEATDWTLGGVQRSLERAVEYFGASRPLNSIELEHVQAWVSWLRANFSGRRGNEVLSDGAVRHHLNALANLYVRAIQEKTKTGVTFNPVAAWGRKRPKGQPKEAHWLEPHEAALFLEACRTYEPEREDVAIPSLYALVATSLLTGGRPAEIRGLEISDVSFARKTVTFRPNEFRRLKTAGSARVVPLWPMLETVIREYLDGPAAPQGKLLFPSHHRRVRGRDGEEMLGDVRKALDAVAVKAGWAEGEVRPYSFRHSYCAARLQTLDRGFPISTFTVGRELGHGGDALVRKIYGHLGQVRARNEVVEFSPAAVTLIEDQEEREKFEKRFEVVQRHLRLVA